MYQDNVKKPMGQWAKKRLTNLKGTDVVRHSSNTGSGFSRDLRKWVGRELALPGNVITVPLIGKNIGHPAVYPVGIPEFFIKLFTKEGDAVLDPFAGSGQTGIAAINLKRNVTLIDNKLEYIDLIKKRLS